MAFGRVKILEEVLGRKGSWLVSVEKERGMKVRVVSGL